MGSKPKFWLVNIRTGQMALWKEARNGTGEDWSEKVAHHIARRLGIPCPRVELATIGDTRGVLSWDFLQRRTGKRPFPRGSLVHGNELLLEADEEYPADQRYKAIQHHIPAVHAVLRHHGPAVGHAREGGVPQVDAFASFIGYLMLDALIGNTDRHHENWGVELPPRDELLSQVELPLLSGRQVGRLAPSYDHASSLGRELNDVKRQRRLDASVRGTVAEYAAKAKSALWSETGQRLLTPLQALGEAATWDPIAFSAWRDHLFSTDLEELSAFVDRVPADRLSPIGKRFTRALLAHNYRQVVDL